MNAADLEGLSAIAHRCWCARLIGEGWRLGPYDPQSRTHDALVAFEALDPRDKRAARLAVEALELEGLLARAIEYDHGPAREFVLTEMREGLEVAWVSAGDATGIERLADRGHIQSWEVDPESGELALIRVRWADGTVSQHYPSQRELRRV